MRYAVKCYDVIGYAFDGDCYCADCCPASARAEAYPIFAGDESADELNCDECRNPLADY